MSDMQAAKQALIETRYEAFKKLKPSEMILAAVKDLEAIEKNPKYIVDMSQWQGLYFGGCCAVCLAGAVMARIGFESADQWPCGEYPEPNFTVALDAFRNGSVMEGLEQLGLRCPESLDRDVNICAYKNNPSRFKKQMRALARRLAKYDL